MDKLTQNNDTIYIMPRHCSGLNSLNIFINDEEFNKILSEYEILNLISGLTELLKQTERGIK